MDRTDNYCGVYEELAGLLNNVSEVEKIYNRFRGLTITFPKKLYSKEYVIQYIKENHEKETVQELARHLDLSDRRIRQVLQHIKNDESSKLAEK